METEKNPEAEIAHVKTFINELEFVQNEYMEALYKSLGVTERGKDYLFDFIYQHTEKQTFGEYLKIHNKTLEELK